MGDLSTEVGRANCTASALTNNSRLAATKRHTMGPQGSQLLDDIERNTHFSSQEIQRLKKRFLKLDRDGSGSIDREEFLQIPAIANNPLAQRLIAIFDADGGGSVDFQEFVHALSVFTSRGSQEEKLQCTYITYYLTYSCV